MLSVCVCRFWAVCLWMNRRWTGSNQSAHARPTVYGRLGRFTKKKKQSFSVSLLRPPSHHLLSSPILSFASFSDLYSLFMLISSLPTLPLIVSPSHLLPLLTVYLVLCPCKAQRLPKSRARHLASQTTTLMRRRKRRRRMRKRRRRKKKRNQRLPLKKRPPFPPPQEKGMESQHKQR